MVRLVAKTYELMLKDFAIKANCRGLRNFIEIGRILITSFLEKIKFAEGAEH